MNIAVCMYYNNAAASYGDYSKKINKLYCKKYGYDFIVANDEHIEYYLKNNVLKFERGYFWDNIINNTDPYYIRYPLLLNIIDNYDWVMWIDSDAYFYNDAFPLENIIKYINYSHSCILSYTITQNLSNQFKDYYINNGIFLMKNIQENKEFLNKMINNHDIIHVAETLHHIYDQSVFRYLYDINYKNFKDNSYVLNYGVLQHFYNNELPYLNYKPYVHHLAATDNKTRVKIIKNYYYKIKYFNWNNIFTFLTVSVGISFFYYFKSTPQLCN